MRMRVVQVAAIAIAATLWSSVLAAAPKDGEISAADALEAAADALERLADAAAESDEELSVDDLEPPGLWTPSTYYDPLIDSFVGDTKPLDEADRAARERVAGKYGLSVATFDQLISLLHDMDAHGYDDDQAPALRSRALQLVGAGNRASLTLLFASAIIDDLTDGCSVADIDLLMAGSRDIDADLWAIAAGCSNGKAMAVAMDKAVAARPALSYLAMNWTSADAASELAAGDVLLTSGFLSQVDPASRERVHADVARYKLAQLFEVGLLDEALAFADSLSPKIRTLALRSSPDRIRATIGGFTLATSAFGNEVASDYAAALALAGRTAEARAVLDLVAPAARRKQARACLDGAVDQCATDRRDQVEVAALIVDQLIERPDADPYALVEGEITDRSSSSGGGVVEALCRLLSQPAEQQDCADGREIIERNRAEKGERDEDDRGLWAAIRRAGGEPFEAARSRYAAMLAALPSVNPDPVSAPRPSVDPAPVPFRELPLPAQSVGRKPPAGVDPEAFAPLPEGYQPVRIERSGQRVAVISLSQRFDPNGEVTAGGYWLHLSEDGGKSWETPLYTGLAEHFPYVVPEKSSLPMIDGDRIRLEVEEALIDTATIYYPPVNTRVKRKRQGIYLEIPIADLRRDSDGDGLSDIAARHLLLDKPAGSATPFLVGSDRDCGTPSQDTLAKLEILKKLLRVEASAVIEQVERKERQFGPWRRTAPTGNPPIFLRGNPADYRCVASNRLMIVYGDEDVQRLRTFSPDFHLVELPPVRWNRDRSRGFVNWNVGWAGGAYRLVRKGRTWELESISQWVT